MAFSYNEGERGGAFKSPVKVESPFFLTLTDIEAIPLAFVIFLLGSGLINKLLIGIADPMIFETDDGEVSVEGL